jgi:Ni/Co efflux regulator RcnB
MNPSKKTLALALFAAVAITPAFADKGGGGHGRGHGGGHDDDRDRVVQVERHHDRHDRDERVVIVDPRHDRSCPPGLAKKNNGCLPPGQAKKMDRVIVGEALPAGAIFTVPQRIRSTLPPPPVGYRYAVVNNQVVLVSSGNIVVDVIRSLLG